MSFGLITLRRPTAVQPFRQNTCWDLYAHKERFQTHFKADKDCLDSSNDCIAIAQSCEIQFALYLMGSGSLWKNIVWIKYSFTWTTGCYYGSGNLFVIIMFLDFYLMTMSWHERYRAYLKLDFLVQVRECQLHCLIRLSTAWGQKCWLSTVSYLCALRGTERATQLSYQRVLFTCPPLHVQWGGLGSQALLLGQLQGHTTACSTLDMLLPLFCSTGGIFSCLVF